MKITLIHCYSDFNKGDLGIILSTIKQLEKLSPGCSIDGVSTYDLGDPQFTNDHKILRNHLDNIYPCIFGILYFKFNGKIYQNAALKMLKFFTKMLRLGPLLLLPKNAFFLKLLLTETEFKTFECLLSSDLIVSKGGSFLCNEDNMRSKLAFFRLVYINMLLRKYKKKYVILGQSLGPVYGAKSIRLLNKVLAGSEQVFLRERLCLETYSYIDKTKCSDIIVNDIAFTLDTSTVVENNLLKSSRLKIGLTVKFVGDNTVYNNMLLETIIFFIKKYDALFIIYPHVTVDDDIVKAKELYFLLEDKYKGNVLVFNNNYTPLELRYMYSQMDLLIGTRLHSTIFSMSAGVPCINIEYHGTKSLGIYQELGLGELVVLKKDFNSTHLINTVELIIKDKQDYADKIGTELEKINDNIELALKPYLSA